MVLFNSIHLFFGRFMYIFLLSVNFEESFFKCCSIINCVSVLASIYVLVKIDENLHCVRDFACMQLLVAVLVRTVVRMVCSLVRRPAASVATILYNSDLLPRNENLERLVMREDLVFQHRNHLFYFLITILRCFC